jgi:hypothetical protein
MISVSGKGQISLREGANLGSQKPRKFFWMKKLRLTFPAEWYRKIVLSKQTYPKTRLYSLNNRRYLFKSFAHGQVGWMSRLACLPGGK